MSGLVGYGSSDEEDDIQPEKPAKIARIDPNNDPNGEAGVKAPPNDSTTADVPVSTTAPPSLRNQLDIDPTAPLAGPTAPSAPGNEPFTEIATPSSPPLSPYSSTRQRIHELTLPPVSDFSIPPDPPPPTDPDEIAAIAATTKKFDRFLELKKNGAHFNIRLQSSSSLRNPSLLPKLMEFAGINAEDAYASTIPEDDGAVPARWREELYVEALVAENARWQKKKIRAAGERVDFVSSKSAGSSTTGTPKGHSKKFDKR